MQALSASGALASKGCYAVPSHDTADAARSAGAGARRFWPRRVRVAARPRANLSLVLQGGGGHIAVTAEPGAKTTLEIETREWDYGVEQFGAGPASAPLVAALVASQKTKHLPPGVVHYP